MSFLLLVVGSIVLTIVCLYYGQLWGLQRTVGPWGGFFLVLFLGPIGLLVILLFPKVAYIPRARRRERSPDGPRRTKPMPTPRPKVTS